MNKKTFWAALLVGVGILIGGCGQKQESVTPIYGVADFETLVKAHPKYSEYFKLETEYKNMTEEYSQERNQLIKVYSAKTQIDNVLENKVHVESAQKELESRIKSKEDELNEKLKKLYNDILSKHRDKITINDNLPEDSIRLANLQMKILVVGISEKEREQAKREIQDLLNKRFSFDEDMSDWTESEKSQFLKSKEDATKELEDFAKKSANEIKEKLSKKSLQKIYSNDNSYPEIESWDKNWQKKLEIKQEQMAKIKSEIMKDIRKDAEKVALEKNLYMIFSDHTINVDAVDVTGDIVNKIIQEE